MKERKVIDKMNIEFIVLNTNIQLTNWLLSANIFPRPFQTTVNKVINILTILDTVKHINNVTVFN